MPLTTEQNTRIELIPRFKSQGYTKADITRRREWLENRSSTSLDHLGNYSIEAESMRGNIENPIGVAQIPIGVAGPLLVDGEHAEGSFFVPLATTEGALVRSYERGMRAISQAGGAEVRICRDSNRTCPIFSFDSLSRAHAFSLSLQQQFNQLKAVAESTSSHGKLLKIKTRVLGRDVIVEFDFYTGDAHGMNMIANATEAACQWIRSQFDVCQHYTLSGGSSEKRASGSLFSGGKGKYVTAVVLLPRRTVQTHLHSTPKKLLHVWQRTLMAQLQAGVNGYNGHFANGLTAIFIACGQDVANVTNSAVGLTNFDLTDEGDLVASVTLPSLTVGTVGGGTGLATARQCLELMDCYGNDRSPKFTEIVCASVLAGELSFAAALASGEFVRAHETYGRNRE